MVSRTGKLPKVIAEHSGYDPSTFITALLNENDQTLESILARHKKNSIGSQMVSLTGMH